MLSALRLVRAKLQQTSPVTKTLFFNPSATPRPSTPEGFAETTAMRRAIQQLHQAQAQPLPPVPPMPEVGERPRIIIHERGHVVTTNKKATWKTPILPFILAIAGGLLVAGIVVLLVSWRQKSGDRARPSVPAVSASAKPQPRP
jgi:hypothetical protein